ncbi:hypothetical protein ACFL2R_01330 [Patescibacteria group bacterium]
MADVKKTTDEKEVEEASVAPVAETTTEALIAPSARYLEFMTPFAKTCGKSVDEVTVALTEAEWINGPDDGALDILVDEDSAPIAEVAADLSALGVKKGPARAAINALRKSATPTTEAAPAAATTSAPVGTVSFDAVLPTVPTDASWVEALRTGGVLKVDQSTVISAIRATLALRAGLFGIPEKLAVLMEKFADENEEQVDPEFFKLRKQMTRRNYSDIFAAVEGLDGTYVTEKRKKQLFKRIDSHLWPAITEFYEQLKSWQETWLQGTTGPAATGAAIAALVGGGGMVGGVLPPGMMQPPDTGILRDSADAVANAINKVFAGTGVQIASALAYDATKIKETLVNPRLPALTGAANRDQMLRQLDVAVSATYPRMETNLTRFVLSVMQVKDQPAGNEELQYFGMMFMLGSQIPWDQLKGGRVENAAGRLSGIGSRSENLMGDSSKDWR